MSWLFGIRNKGAPPPDFNAGGDLPPVGGSGDDRPQQPTMDEKARRSAMEAYRFDSSALERAAAAAKELEKSTAVTSSISFFSMRRTCQRSARTLQAPGDDETAGNAGQDEGVRSSNRRVEGRAETRLRGGTSENVGRGDEAASAEGSISGSADSKK
ncbi:unnamed protein product, partial [Nesidiocoris tenuis]